jgi:acetolactate synthase-1/2/3 large subunit
VPELVALAETLQAPVFDLVGFQAYYNFPLSNPLHAGSDAGPFLAEADVVLVAECDVPWVIGSGREPSPDATIISLGNDPLYSRIPVRGFRIDIPVAGQPRLSLRAINEALSALTVDEAAREQRRRRWADHQAKLIKTLEERAMAGRSSRPLSKAWVSYCMEQLRDESTVMVNELGFDPAYFRYNHPGSIYAFSSAGVLGWGVGAALGIKLAAPEKTVIAGLGDGSYMFGVPEAGHWVSRKMGLPVLYVIWNNSQWGAVANATRQVFPEGWAARNHNFAFTDLSPSIDFEKVCEASGGYGERVEDPEEVIPALQRGLHAVRVEKRTALINMIGEQR